MGTWLSFGFFFTLLASGFPIALGMGFAAFVAIYLVEGMPLVLLAQRISSPLSSFTYLAVPLFLLAGNLMNEIGITDRLFSFARAVVGRIPGGLGHVNVVASMVFAGMSGSAIADAAGLGVIEMKAMRDAGYDVDFSAAITAASSTIGPIIPPSIMIVLYGVLAEVSIGHLFLASFLPGAVMGLCLMVAIYVQVVRKTVNAPLDPKISFKEFISRTIKAIPALVTPLLLIGGMVTGFFTATEASAVAVIYTLVLGLVLRTITWEAIVRAIKASVITSCAVLLIIACANIFVWVITIYKVPEMITAAIVSVTENKYLIILLINAILLFLGMIMSINAVLILLLPILLVIANTAGINLVHMGVFVVLGLQIGLITPPVGLVLYVMSDIAKISLERISRALLPYIVALIVALVIVSLWEDLVLFVPRLFGANL